MARAATNPDDLLQISEAARFVGISPDWLRDLANRSRVPAIRTVGGVRLFKRQDLQAYMEERKRQPPRRGRPKKKTRKVAKKKTGVRKKK